MDDQYHTRCHILTFCEWGLHLSFSTTHYIFSTENPTVSRFQHISSIPRGRRLVLGGTLIHLLALYDARSTHQGKGYLSIRTVKLANSLTSGRQQGWFRIISRPVPGKLAWRDTTSGSEDRNDLGLPLSVRQEAGEALEFQIQYQPVHCTER